MAASELERHASRFAAPGVRIARRTSVARRRGGFRPPHCPNPNCRFHLPHPDWHFVRNGYFTRTSDLRRIQCFLCRHCRRSFSTQTFSSSYWLRRPRLLKPVAAWIVEGPALRQIARVLHASPNTIARLASRLGRHCLLYHSRLSQQLPRTHTPHEHFVIDGFESFEFSQYFPFHLNLTLGASSHWIYDFNQAPLRRKGSMSPFQKRRRAQLESRFGRPDPKAIQKAFQALIRNLSHHHPHGHPLVLATDDHPAYRRGLAPLAHDPALPAIEQRVTPSRVRRTTANPLFPVNLADLLLRHGSANHRRETIAFSKQRQGACERAAIFMVWRNCVKRWSEKGGEQTAGMRAGFLHRPLSWSEILRRRIFRNQINLSEAWSQIYERRVVTAVYGHRQAIHACRYAF